MPLYVAKYLVGINSHVESIILQLDIGSNDVRMLGMYGPSGVGKTTIAKAIYKKFFIVSKEATFWKMLEKSQGHLMALSNYKRCFFVRP